MVNLNLQAKETREELVLAYLRENASEILAGKINNGVRIMKDGKEVINKKNLTDFMKYACNEARKQAPQGATGTFIDNDTVYGWAMHFFEEDSLEGTLYNFDGTEYKTVRQPAPAPIKVAPKKPEGPKQYSLFDFEEENTEEKEEVPDNEEEETENEIIEEKPETKETPKGNSIYQHYMACQQEHPEAVVAYRLGDFYEVFGQRAEEIADDLILTLTGRDCGLEEYVPMVGFPIHMAEIYFSKILEKRDVYVIESKDKKRFIKAYHTPKVNEDGEIIGAEKTDKEEMLEALFEMFDYKVEVRL